MAIVVDDNMEWYEFFPLIIRGGGELKELAEKIKI